MRTSSEWGTKLGQICAHKGSIGRGDWLTAGGAYCYGHWEVLVCPWLDPGGVCSVVSVLWRQFRMYVCGGVSRVQQTSACALGATWGHQLLLWARMHASHSYDSGGSCKNPEVTSVMSWCCVTSQPYFPQPLGTPLSLCVGMFDVFGRQSERGGWETDWWLASHRRDLVTEPKGYWWALFACLCSIFGYGNKWHLLKRARKINTIMSADSLSVCLS